MLVEVLVGDYFGVDEAVIFVQEVVEAPFGVGAYMLVQEVVHSQV